MMQAEERISAGMQIFHFSRCLITFFDQDGIKLCNHILWLCLAAQVKPCGLETHCSSKDACLCEFDCEIHSLKVLPSIGAFSRKSGRVR